MLHVYLKNLIELDYSRCPLLLAFGLCLTTTKFRMNETRILDMFILSLGLLF